MNTILAIDPGPVKSAYVVWDGERIIEFGIEENEGLIRSFDKFLDFEWMAIEKITSLGMPVGASVFETVFWTGRFCQRRRDIHRKWYRVPRMDVKMHLCHSSRAKDSNIRQALIDRFEPDLPPKCRPKGIFKGISKDCWQALALAVYWHDTRKGEPRCN